MTELLLNKLGDGKSTLLMKYLSSYSLIWLHGLGDSPAGFFDFFQSPHSPLHKGARIVLLHAPVRPVTINGGVAIPSWYDIKIMKFKGSDKKTFSIEEINESLDRIDRFVKQEIAFWKTKEEALSEEQICRKIFIGGFSQGCAMSMLYALTSKRLLGGVIGCSGHLFESYQFPNKGKIPMQVYHGTHDEVIPYEDAKSGYDKLLAGAAGFSFHPLKGEGHTVTEDELKESTQWILNQIKEVKKPQL